jgi:hypothetical protein
MRKLCVGILLAILAILTFHLNRDFGKIGAIALHVGKPYKEVLRDSTSPVKSKTVIRQTTPPVEDSTWITSPVIVKFDDPQHSFILPPTKLLAVGYSEGKVTTFTTSPMLETLPFDQLIPLLDHIQQMLKKSGWIPEFEGERNSWFKIESEADRNALQSLLFKQAVTAALLVPRKYGMSLIVKCYARCDKRDPNTARYLIDVSVGRDYSHR